MNHVVVHVLLWHDNNFSTLQSWSEMLRITPSLSLCLHLLGIPGNFNIMRCGVIRYRVMNPEHQGILKCVNSLSELLRLEKDYWISPFIHTYRLGCYDMVLVLEIHCVVDHFNISSFYLQDIKVESHELENSFTRCSNGKVESCEYREGLKGVIFSISKSRLLQCLWYICVSMRVVYSNLNGSDFGTEAVATRSMSYAEWFT